MARPVKVLGRRSENRIAELRARQAEDGGLVSSDQLLTYWSRKDETWDIRRNTADELSRFFCALAEKDARFFSWASRIWDCAGLLLFRWQFNPDGKDIGLRLAKANFCRVRLCPICMWRRSLLWLARFLTALPEILKKYPEGRWVAMTLTVKNPPIGDLSKTLDLMNAGWKRLLLRREFAPVLGWVRATEVTRGESGPGECHPHFHVLLFLKPSYFHHYYVSQENWSLIWKDVCRLDYVPIVWVETVTESRSKKANEVLYAHSIPEGVDPIQWKLAIAGALEVMKYTVKPLDLVPESQDDQWLATLAQQLHKRRLIAAGGVLKDVLKEIESDEDLVHCGDDEPENELADIDDGSRLAFVPKPIKKQRFYQRESSSDVRGKDDD